MTHCLCAGNLCTASLCIAITQTSCVMWLESSTTAHCLWVHEIALHATEPWPMKLRKGHTQCMIYEQSEHRPNLQFLLLLLRMDTCLEHHWHCVAAFKLPCLVADQCCWDMCTSFIKSAMLFELAANLLVWSLKYEYTAAQPHTKCTSGTMVIVLTSVCTKVAP